jgi:TnpA family transposase
MKRSWHSDELAHHWTLSDDERALLANKTGATRLAFAVLLKTFQFDGRFPERPEAMPRCIVAHLAQQTGVPPAVYAEVDWTGRSSRRHWVQILHYCGFRAFRAEDEPALVDWLSTRVATLDPHAEAFKLAAYTHLRRLHVEPPPSDRLSRLLRTAVRHREERLGLETFAQLSPATREALDTLLHTDAPEDEADQAPLFPVKSDLATLKDGAGAVKVATVHQEIEKLRQLRALGLPETLFEGVPVKVVTQYRQRAGSEPPRELRRHPPHVRYTLLAALCWQKQREITDTLVDLLLHIAHRIDIRAEDKVHEELLKHLKKVAGKTQLLYKLAKVCKQHPDGIVKDVIYPAVGQQTIDVLVQEAEADSAYDTRVRLVTRASYSHHYRRVVPVLLDVLHVRCNNDIHRPVMQALALLERYRDSTLTTFPRDEDVPLDGVVRDDWRDLVEDEKHPGCINRISYEVCLLSTLRDKVRCKEVWVQGAQRFRNPDEDVPQDFGQRREEYYAALGQPVDAQTFVATLRGKLEAALTAFDADVPHNPKVRLLTSKEGKGRIVLSPSDPLPEAPHLDQLKAALMQRWPMTNLLDILKETELRVRFTDVFRTVGVREVLPPEVLRRRLLLALYGLGTNAGLKRMSSGGSGDSYDDVLYVRRKYITKEQLRTAIGRVCNAIFTVRHPHLWGEATTACASDAKKFGAWDQNLMTEWHVRYGGPGVMVYWHVEERSVCIYSQLKSCSSSEVAAMIEGVLRHETDMEVEKNYVDTHGQSEVGFAFCALLGFELLPRLKNLKKQRLYRPNKGEAERYANLQAILTRPIQWELIAAQFDEMIKFATALRLGTAGAEAILRRFTRSNVQHPTYRALAELGKALKTIFLCDYLRLESLRREIHEGLQVIEHWNSANDFILYGKGGEFASNRLDDQEMAMLSLHLLQVSLVYINTLIIQQVLAEPSWQSRLTAADLRALTPLLWAHVNPYGTFTLNMRERLPLEQAA